MQVRASPLLKVFMWAAIDCLEHHWGKQRGYDAHATALWWKAPQLRSKDTRSQGAVGSKVLAALTIMTYPSSLLHDPQTYACPDAFPPCTYHRPDSRGPSYFLTSSKSLATKLSSIAQLSSVRTQREECDICLLGDDNELLQCLGCRVAMHPSCLGRDMHGDWVCARCRLALEGEFDIECFICSESEGLLVQLRGDWVHLFCVVSHPGLFVPDL
jgi:hypothetical protein